MVRKMEVEDIAKIAFIEDHLETHLTCSKGEWVQWLIQNVDNPSMLIIGDFSDTGEIKGYMVLVNNVVPPVFNFVASLFTWTRDGNIRCDRDTVTALQAEASRWGKEIGARRGVATVPNTHNMKYMESLGGKLIASIYEWEID